MLRRYLQKQQLNHGAINLFVHHFIRIAGTGLLGIFGPIYIYQQYEKVEAVLLYNGAVYLLLFLLFPAAMKVVNAIGFKKAMIISLFFLSALNIAFYLAGSTNHATWWFVVAAVFHILNVLLYWVPYHTDFTLLTKRTTRGRNLALLTSAIALVAVILPLVSSLIITQFGFGLLFVLSVILILFSILYLKKTPEINEHFSFSPWQTYKELFKKRNLRLFIAYAADSAQGIVGSIVWPVFIFLLLDGDFFSVGFVTALIVLATIIIQLVFGNLADHFSKSKLIRFSSVFHSAGWVLKSIVQTPFQIFAAGTYHDLTKSATQISFVSLMYEQAGSVKHYVDEYSVLRELGVCFGRFVVMFVAIVLLQFVGLDALFWIAAVTSLFMGLL